MKKLSLKSLSILYYQTIQFFPDNIPESFLISYEEILKLENFIKFSSPNKKILHRLLDIVLDLLENNRRFQKFRLVKLIQVHSKFIVVNKTLLEKFFKVYQNLIFNSNAETCWKLSVILKEVILNNQQINWLIENAKENEFIQNRLLRYPQKNKLISNWAKEMMSKNLLESRKSELIGLILNFDQRFLTDNNNNMMWAIHYSKLSPKDKQSLLKKYLTDESLSEFIEVCSRNQFFGLIAEVYLEQSELHEGVI